MPVTVEEASVVIRADLSQLRSDLSRADQVVGAGLARAERRSLFGRGGAAGLLGGRNLARGGIIGAAAFSLPAAIGVGEAAVHGFRAAVNALSGDMRKARGDALKAGNALSEGLSRLPLIGALGIQIADAISAALLNLTGLAEREVRATEKARESGEKLARKRAEFDLRAAAALAVAEGEGLPEEEIARIRHRIALRRARAGPTTERNLREIIADAELETALRRGRSRPRAQQQTVQTAIGAFNIATPFKPATETTQQSIERSSKEVARLLRDLITQIQQTFGFQ